jgi:hypothetical protein
MKNKYLVRTVLIALIAIVSLSACKGKKKPSLSGDEPVDISDFISFFHDASLPLTVSDTSLNRKLSDSLLISSSVFSSFIPDSLLGKDFGKSKPKIYSLGKAKEKGKETYLFIKAIQGGKRVAYVLCFDKNNKFLTSLPLLKSSSDNNYTSAYGSLDKKFQVTTYRERKDKSVILNFKRNIYIYNSASSDFTLIVTEPGQELSEDIQNPVDTLSQKNKFTGDYQADKRNFISFRDSRRASEIIFFAHFEKNKGECKGEIKGAARFVSPKVAQYKENGNPCTLEFTFNASSVSMKEVEGCGSYRDIKCFFDGTYPKKKKKEIKQKSTKTQHKK